ncbi:S8 family peptidase [Microbacteriaceae bacterium VKM Ac-2854]|nr:S8 family peptidase [Microbacteriaceae bacterium VKM Ac-2854]
MPSKRRAAATLTALALAATALAPIASAAPTATSSYIVQTTQVGATGAAIADAGIAESAVSERYSRVLKGFAAELTPAEVARLNADPTVVSVTPDGETSIAEIQTDPTWGLDRIDQRTTTGDGTYGYDTTGKGVTVFVVDSGIRFSHEELGGRARSGWDFVDSDADASDCNGHGTHVAGTIGGKNYGVAKEVSFVSLRVFSCGGSGSWSAMIAAFDWAVANKPTTGASVINISGGGGGYEPMDTATTNTIAAGIPVVAAAGNGNTDTCSFSPARTPNAIAVSATDSSDYRAYFSNYGSCTDLFAPGVDVLSSTIDSDTATGYKSGTSMATPHVAGLVARYQQANPSASPAQVTSALLAAATPNVVLDPVGSPNLLAYAAPPAATLTGPTPTISGTPRVGTVLTANPGAWSPQPVTLGYQWKRGGTAIAGATASTYTPVAADQGAAVTVTVTGSKTGYTALAKTSAAVTVTPGLMTLMPTPTISGTTTVGSTLTANPGTWDPGTTLTYQWKKNGGSYIVGATSQSYLLKSSDLGATLTVSISATKPGYSPATKTSATTAAITSATTIVGTTPTITGTPTVGQKLTAVPGAWSPAPVTLAYQWKRGGAAIAGATASSYTLTAADANSAITVSVTGTKSGFAAVTKTSAAVTVQPAPLVLTPTPTISGTAAVGNTLTANAGTWDAGVTIGYQWKRSGVAIGGATAKTYVLVAADAGTTITVSVTGTKTGSATTTKTSAPTGVIAGGAVLSGSVPTISGSVVVGRTLTADPGTWGPAPVALSYQWKRAGVVIAGATGASYTLVGEDLGNRVSVSVTGTKPGYATLTKSSASSTVVTAASLRSATPTITGTAAVGQKLTANPGDWAPQPVSYAYAWYRGGSAIAGATAATYTPVAADAGTALTVRVTGSKLGYTTVTQASAAKTIAAGTLTAPTPTISGTATVGQTLTAKPGTWGPAPVALTYQWYRGSTAIPGATATTYKLVTADKGASITVRVTGTKAGYTTVTKSSTAMKAG